MQVELVLVDGDYYLITDLDNAISLKTISLGKFISQKKKKGQIIFVYEFADDFKFPKKKGRKSKKAKEKGSASNISHERHPNKLDSAKTQNDAFEAEDLGEVEGTDAESLEQQEDDEMGIAPTKRYGHATALKIRGRKLDMVDDESVKEEKVEIPCKRIQAKMKQNHPTKPIYKLLTCCACHKPQSVPLWEFNMYKEMFWRCCKCCGGG